MVLFSLGGATKRSVLVISHPALLSKEATPSSAAGELKLDERAALSRDSQERAGRPAPAKKLEAIITVLTELW